MQRISGHYNQLAGRSVERIAGLTDGLFAIAMTLLVLDIKVPDAANIHSGAALGTALCALTPRLVTYLLSFMTLGIFWVGQGTQLRCIERADRHFTWLQIAVLAVVAVIPFSTGLLAEFITFRLALLFYWVNILLFGITVYACWSYARRAGLYKSDVTPEMELAFRNRVIRAQALYAIGAVLCIVNTYWSIGFIVAVQIVYATAPPVRWLQKLTG